MKKFVALMLSIVLLGTMFVMTGCSKKMVVEFTVDGIDAYAATPVDKNIRNGVSRQEDKNNPDAPAKYTFNIWADGDYSLVLVDKNENSYPITLKIHNGKVAAEAPEGVTVTATMK